MKNKKGGLVYFLSLGLVGFVSGQILVERGKEVYGLKRGRCHTPFAPQKYPSEEGKNGNGQYGNSGWANKRG